MKKTFISLFLAVLLVSLTAIWIYYKADSVILPTNIKIKINETEVMPSNITWHIPVIDDINIFGKIFNMPQGLKKLWILDKAAAMDTDLKAIKSEELNMDIELPYQGTLKVANSDGVEIYSGEAKSISFTEKGMYDLRVDMEIPDSAAYKGSGSLTYFTQIEITPKPQINFNSDTIKQGDLVRIDIKNIFKSDTLNVTSDFKISNISREDTQAFFYIPITYYKEAQRYNLAININEELYEYRYEVEESQFTVIHFAMDQSVAAATVNSSSANQEYREKIHPLYTTRSEEKYWDGKFIKPVQETRISSTFGQKRYVNNSKSAERHSGIDYAAPTGTPIYAPQAGKVEFAGFLQLSGYTIVIEHGLGLKSYYFHMNEVFVEKDDMVSQGDKIGEVGTTGYSTGPHLHFQVSIENQPINPEFLYEYEG